MGIQVLDACNRTLGAKDSHTITTMRNLAAIHKCLGKHTEGEKLQIQAQKAHNRIFGGKHSHKINTTPNANESQETQVFDARNTVLEEEISNLIEMFSILHI